MPKGLLAKAWRLCDQLQRAVVSIAANVAEGYEREGRKEYLRYLQIAKGSAGELRCLLRLAVRLGYLPDQCAPRLLAETLEVSRMLKGLMASLQSDYPSPFALLPFAFCPLPFAFCLCPLPLCLCPMPFEEAACPRSGTRLLL